MISLFHIWSLCLLILALRGGDIRLAAGAGFLSGLGLLVKMPLAPLVGSCVAIGLLSIPREKWAAQTKTLLAFAGGLAAAMLILLPNLDKMFKKDTVYALGIGATERSAGLFARNLGLVFDWLSGYNSMIFVVAAVACVGLAIYRKNPLRIALAVLFAAPVLAMSWTLSVFYARYILATLLPLTLLMGLTIPEFVLGAEEENNG
jgi:4-amino-4-deoxy-L-arabinose transferase-like glycosyltransferase